jgi:serine protease inhibitor
MPKSKQFLSKSWVLGLSLAYGCSTPLASPQAPLPSPNEPIISPEPSVIPKFNLSAEELDKIKQSPLTKANNDFSWKLFHKIFENNQTENHFISGLSATLALQMVLAGTENETRDEMLTLLSLQDIPREQLTEDIPLFMQRLTQNPEVQLDIANSVWSGNRFPLNPEWVNLLQTQFKGDAQRIEFTRTEELDKVNQWASDKTQGKIQNVVPNPYPNAEDIVYILMNAIYFNGNWTYEFDPLETVERPFFVDKNTEVNVQMMRQFNAFHYRTPNEAFPHQSVALPYGKNKSLSMYIFLPSADKTLTDLVADLKNVGFDTLLPDFYTERGSLRLPQFKIEKTVELKQVLAEMGADKTLHPGVDFKGLQNPSAQVTMDRITQKSFVQVNEKGTEAAVVTTVVFTQPSSEPLRTMDMNVNRPFLFVIRDEGSSQILFTGSMTHPVSTP